MDMALTVPRTHSSREKDERSNQTDWPSVGEGRGKTTYKNPALKDLPRVKGRNLINDQYIEASNHWVKF